MSVKQTHLIGEKDTKHELDIVLRTVCFANHAIVLTQLR